MTRHRSEPGIELRAEQPDDAGFVDGLVRANLREAMAGLDLGPLLELQLRSRAAMLEQNFPDLRRRVAWAGTSPVGSLLTGARDGAVHVVEIVVAPGWRRGGVATAMLAQVREEARRAQQAVTAHIFITNTASLTLFRRAGFTLTMTPGAAQTVARASPD